jgi:hypothetical protein
MFIAICIVLEQTYYLHVLCEACPALYRHLWHARSYNIFPYYLITGKIFEKRLLI